MGRKLGGGGVQEKSHGWKKLAVKVWNSLIGYPFNIEEFKGNPPPTLPPCGALLTNIFAKCSHQWQLEKQSTTIFFRFSKQNKKQCFKLPRGKYF